MTDLGVITSVALVCLTVYKIVQMLRGNRIKMSIGDDFKVEADDVDDVEEMVKLYKNRNNPED